MQYTLTRQYVRDMETPLAAFKNLDDANIFIEKKMSIDEKLNIKIIYRLYNGDVLSKDFNIWKIHFSAIQIPYLLGDCNPSHAHINPFTVSKRRVPLAKFMTVDDAALWIELKLSKKQAAKDTYALYENNKLLEEFDLKKIKSLEKSKSTPQTKTQTALFKPTPFNITPRPPGTPPKWLVDEEGEEGDSDEK